MPVNKKALTLKTNDGYTLSAYEYSSGEHSQDTNKPIIVVAGATAVPQRFYQRFAHYAVEQGATVITLDYRGVGESAPETLVGFDMRYLQWATEDLAAAIAHAQGLRLTTNQERPILLIGHSFGGHALGLLPNIEFVDGAYVFGVGSGWHGWMPYLESLKVRLLWHVIAPILVRVYGYLPWNKLGLGEDLPINVYRDWKYWCQFPHYFFDDPDMSHVADLFARFDKPLVALNAVDDKWAQPASRDAFFKGYSNAQLKTVDIQPADVGLREIDHMGYFKKNSQLIWQGIVDWSIRF
jgi:predicted alpha/beta hydrolase